MRIKIHQKVEIERDKITTKAIKALHRFDELKGLELAILGMPFGDDTDEGQDSEGEFFNSTTDPVMKMGDEVVMTFFHGFALDGKGLQNPPQFIGMAKLDHEDELGLHFIGRLDPVQPLAARITLERLEAGIIKASSGAVGHLVRREDNGLLSTWAVGELAIFDTNNQRQPANQAAVVSLNSERSQGNLVKVTDRSNEAVLPDYLLPVILEEIL